MYCEKCKHLFEGDHCPNCRKSHVRPVQPEDPCFLVEKGAPWNGMLTDVLRQNDIPFLTDGRMGAAWLPMPGPGWRAAGSLYALMTWIGPTSSWMNCSGKNRRDNRLLRRAAPATLGDESPRLASPL